VANIKVTEEERCEIRGADWYDRFYKLTNEGVFSFKFMNIRFRGDSNLRILV